MTNNSPVVRAVCIALICGSNKRRSDFHAGPIKNSQNKQSNGGLNYKLNYWKETFKMAWEAFSLWKLGQLDHSAQPGAPVDFDTDTFGIMLLTTAGGAPNLNTIDDVAAMLSSGSVAEVTGTGYDRKPLASPDAVNSSGTITVDASDPAAYAQQPSGFSDAKYAVYYKNASSVDANSPVIAIEEFTSALGNITGSLTLQLSASGIFTFA
jgi:hypothetical protein